MPESLSQTHSNPRFVFRQVFACDTQSLLLLLYGTKHVHSVSNIYVLLRLIRLLLRFPYITYNNKPKSK